MSNSVVTVRWIGVEQAAALLGVPPLTLRRAFSEAPGGLPTAPSWPTSTAYMPAASVAVGGSG